MSNESEQRTTDKEVCPHCAGTGAVPVRAAESFPVGSTVLWRTGSWWGTLTAEVIAHSKTGQRVKVKYRAPQAKYDTYSYVMPKSLESPHE